MKVKVLMHFLQHFDISEIVTFPPPLEYAVVLVKGGGNW